MSISFLGSSARNTTNSKIYKNVGFSTLSYKSSTGARIASDGGTILNLKTIVGGSNIVVVDNSNAGTITISSTASGGGGPVNVANLGSGIAIGDSSGNTVKLKTFVNGSGITLITDTDTITISSSGFTDVVNKGSGSILGDSSGNTLLLKTLVAGTNVTLSSTANSVIINSTASGGGEITGSVTTNDATATTIITLNTMSDTVYGFSAFISAANSTDNTGNSYFYKAAFKNVSGTVSQISTIDDTLFIREDGTSSVDVAISGTDILLQVTGVAGKTIKWTATLTIQTSAF